MSGYDEMPTAELVALARRSSAALRAELHPDVATASGAITAAVTDRLEAYERIVAALRDVPPSWLHDVGQQCALCDAPVTPSLLRQEQHDPKCPWLLAQQTGSGE